MEITQQEKAAMWLYHSEYAKLGLGAVEFYKRLGQYEKNNVDRMIADVMKYSDYAALVEAARAVVNACHVEQVRGGNIYTPIFASNEVIKNLAARLLPAETKQDQPNRKDNDVHSKLSFTK